MKMVGRFLFLMLMTAYLPAAAFRRRGGNPWEGVCGKLLLSPLPCVPSAVARERVELPWLLPALRCLPIAIPFAKVAIKFEKMLLGFIKMPPLLPVSPFSFIFAAELFYRRFMGCGKITALWHRPSNL